MTARFSLNQQNTRGHRPRLQRNSYGRTAVASISTLNAGSANCWIWTKVLAGGFAPTYLVRTAATSEARNSEMLVTYVVVLTTALMSAPWDFNAVRIFV